MHPACLLLSLLAGVTLIPGRCAAQLPLIPSVPVEQTRVSVFPSFTASLATQTIEHPHALANFRLTLEYRLPTPKAKLAIRLTPGKTIDLPSGNRTSWHTLDLRHERLPAKPGLLAVRVDDKPILREKLPPPAKDSVATSTLPLEIPGIATKLSLLAEGGAEIRGATVQALAEADHAVILSRWNRQSLAAGESIYQTLCITCHGTDTKEGSMPTSRRFGKEPLKNGTDPFRLYQTITRGYGQMMPLPQYTPEQRYAVIHYIRETFLAPHRPQDLTPIDPAYLASLPPAMETVEKPTPTRAPAGPPHERMDFGPALHWTYQVARGNIAQKGLAVRLDPGEGGVSKGHAWMVHDLDTQRVAAVTSGSFINWRGVAFDGSHGTHPSLTGKILFANPPGPGWANPADGSWADPRPLDREGRPYGPLPRAWSRHLGSFTHGPDTILRYSVGDAIVLDAAECAESGTSPVLLRTLNVSKASRDLKLRLAPAEPGLLVRVAATGLNPREEDGFLVLAIPAGATPLRFRITIAKGLDHTTLDALAQAARLPLDLATLTCGGPPRWPQTVTTRSTAGDESGPFATDVLTHPDLDANPWSSLLRLTGFDFFPDGNRAAVCTWMGDVWIVDGIHQAAPAELRWRRIATGLFQPLGLKIRNNIIHVCCRDQIAKLLDHNGDGETDEIACFNTDHQVTENFHEFAMGLQADDKGNFYYAKSARHALPALVPHHGTLLRVSADGSRTDILASGFRAANGICLNPDGTFFVTDQEGNWTPKNRVNLVKGEGPSEFFGNMWGFHDVTDPSDSAMKQPLCWITNAFDRSPSELVWVPRDAAWGPLNGSLLNLSYGYGKIYTVPHQIVNGQAQGGMCSLPIPQFPTGTMRGRFHPIDKQFYTCGMFAWAGNQTQAGGFYRVRSTGKQANQPVGLHFEKGLVRVRFSNPLDPAAADPARHQLKAWKLRRSADYGSPHLDEHPLSVAAARLGPADTLTLDVPSLHPTMCLEIRCRLPQSGQADVERVIHATVHELP